MKNSGNRYTTRKLHQVVQKLLYCQQLDGIEDDVLLLTDNENYLKKHYKVNQQQGDWNIGIFFSLLCEKVLKYLTFSLTVIDKNNLKILLRQPLLNVLIKFLKLYVTLIFF